MPTPAYDRKTLSRHRGICHPTLSIHPSPSGYDADTTPFRRRADVTGRRHRSYSMRVLHVLSSLERRHGGPVAALVGLAGAQARAGVDVTVLATYTAGADLSAAEQLRRNVARVELVGPCARLMSRHPELATTTDRFVGRADVAHIHAMWEDVQHQAA